MSVKGDVTGIEVWSWVDQPSRSDARPGRHSRPWSIRDRMVMEAMGEEIRRQRTAKGWSARRLAKRLSCSQVHVTNLENGRTSAWITMLWDLADIFDVEPQHFIAVADAAIARFEAGGRRTIRKTA